MNSKALYSIMNSEALYSKLVSAITQIKILEFKIRVKSSIDIIDIKAHEIEKESLKQEARNVLEEILNRL